MRAAMAEESRPPERNMPRGTSLMRRMQTVCSRRSRHSEIQEESVRVSGWGSGISQYWRISGWGDGVEMSSVRGWPGINLRMPRKRVRSSLRYPKARYSGRRDSSNWGEMEGCSRSALISLAKANAGAEEFAGVLIPDGKGEHATQAEKAFGAVLLVGVEDGFGVGAAGVAVAGLFEGGAEAGVIEDFAVEDDEKGRVFIGHGLVAAGHIDDGEAAESEGGPGVAVVAGIIGAAVADGVRHTLDDRGGAGRLNSYESCDSTHERSDGLILTLPCGYGGALDGSELAGRAL